MSDQRSKKSEKDKPRVEPLPQNVRKLANGEKTLFECPATYMKTSGEEIIGRCYVTQNYVTFFSMLFQAEISILISDIVTVVPLSSEGLKLMCKSDEFSFICIPENDLEEMKTYISALMKGEQLGTLSKSKIEKILKKTKKESSYTMSESAVSTPDKKSTRSESEMKRRHTLRHSEVNVLNHERSPIADSPKDPKFDHRTSDGFPNSKFDTKSDTRPPTARSHKGKSRQKSKNDHHIGPSLSTLRVCLSDTFEPSCKGHIAEAKCFNKAKVFMAQSFECSLKKLYSIVLRDSFFWSRTLASFQYESIIVEEWAETDPTSPCCFIRHVNFETNVSNPLVGNKHPKISQTHHLFKNSNGAVILEIESAASGIPFADAFNTFMRYVFEPNSTDTQTTISTFNYVLWKKSFPSFTKALPEKIAISSNRDFFKTIFDRAQCILSGKEPPSFVKGEFTNSNANANVKPSPEQSSVGFNSSSKRSARKFKSSKLNTTESTNDMIGFERDTSDLLSKKDLKTAKTYWTILIVAVVLLFSALGYKLNSISHSTEITSLRLNSALSSLASIKPFENKSNISDHEVKEYIINVEEALARISDLSSNPNKVPLMIGQEEITKGGISWPSLFFTMVSCALGGLLAYRLLMKLFTTSNWRFLLL